MSTAIDHSKARLPQTYQQARTALQAAVDVDECKDYADKAAALATYAKQSNDHELEKMAAKIRGRAVRRMGEILNDMESARGGDRGGGRGNQGEARRPLVSRKQAAEDAGISEHQQKQAQNVAKVPEAEFEAAIESDNPPSVKALADKGRERRPVDTGGRSSEEFQAAMALTALITNLARDFDRYEDKHMPVEDGIAHLDDGEKAEIREAFARLSRHLDQLKEACE